MATEKKGTLLVDSFGASKNVISEANEVVNNQGKNGKHWHLKGIFMQAEIENLNGRIYPLDEMTREVKGMEQRIHEGHMVFGELDHPEDLVVNLANSSHFIKEIHMDGNNAVGDIQILDTVPAGKIVCGLLETPEVHVGVSSRGTGIVDEYTSIVDDFKLITIDIVAVPSAQDATPMAVFENLRSPKGQMLVDAAANCIRTNHAHTQELNEDIVKWLKDWNPYKRGTK